ncbi:unnamed protein product [Urochloa decumbens]|uniref:NADP-dependent oxidoreductase domain-containing protein n=1 Tax=Urochloa decumbens TaxID=240449 RepID=A0ABC9EP22_9POAL
MAAKDVAPAVTLGNGHGGGMVPVVTPPPPSNGHRRAIMAPAVTLSSGQRAPDAGGGAGRVADGGYGRARPHPRRHSQRLPPLSKYQNEAEVGDALAEAFQTGLVKREDLFISICNYGVFLTRDCLAYAKIKPAVNQIEMHPYFQRDSLVKFCQKHGICATANAKLFGSLSCLDDPVIKELAEKYGKTPAQLVLRWGLQKNTVVIPKTSKVERLQENLELFDFDISDEDMQEIKAIDRNHRSNQPAKFWGIDVYS